MKKILIIVIRFYQKAISPFLGKNCRFIPTCSQYALEAINRYGALRGGWLGLKRICRCHPWGKFGYDPVPDLQKTKNIKNSLKR